ncbi:MAG: c-type cytochrome [Terriglobales bacterium]|jgi:cytochrome c
MSTDDIIPILRKPGKLATFILLMLIFVLPACNWFRDFDFERGARLTGGDPELGRTKLAMHSCVSCHVIPGVPRGEGNSAPSLAHWSRRRTFLNTYPNTPENLEKWLEKPSHRKPGTAMPDMNLSPQDSRDMTAYLFSIN